ncbi:MAG TPA: CCA tRNA nucleotidyltransferase, partial [Rhodospirillales bacterium]|nr:CCA tRNA nucleotidyltransferase [Rhodospirillales bacterium]
ARWLAAPETRRVLAALAATGKESRFVGGCVRDTLRDPERDTDDLDIATAARPEEVMASLRDAGIKVVPTGLRHGTVTAIPGDRHYEITTLRRDVECFGRHAAVEFTEDFEADAARRDFTINAMSCDAEGRLYDYFGGREDLAAGRVRFVGDPRGRIREDYLRILRFFRFFARFGRPPADGAALEACAAEAAGLDRLSGERIREELLRLLAAPGVLAALDLMAETGVLARILPVPVHRDRLARLLELAPEADPLLRLAALLRGPEADASRVLTIAHRLRLSRRETERLLRLTTAPLPDPGAPEARHKAAIYRLGGRTYADLLRLAAAEGAMDRSRLEALLALTAAWTPPVFPLAGRDVLARGVPAGPEVGRLLRALEDWWLEGGLAADREALLAELERRLSA